MCQYDNNVMKYYFSKEFKLKFKKVSAKILSQYLDKSVVLQEREILSSLTL